MFFCNGQVATTAQLAALGRINYGHFTTLPIHYGAVKGWDYHVQRLRHATRVLFATELDCTSLQTQIQHGIDQTGLLTAHLRITICSLDHVAEPVQKPSIDSFLHFSPIVQRPATSLAVCSQCHQRMLPEIKHVATFSSYYYQRRARAAGFDDVLFTTDKGLVAEGAFWNIGFWDGERIIWPEAAILAGTGQMLIAKGLRALNVPTTMRPIHIADIPHFRAAFMCNALGHRSIRAIDDHPLLGEDLLPMLDQALAQTSWQPMDRLEPRSKRHSSAPMSACGE